MADAASITMSITILPDEIAKTLTAITSGYTPAGDGTEKWYYKITEVSNTSTDLISGAYISEEAVGTAHDTISTSDVVKFLYIKNVGSNSVYVVLDGGTVSSSSTDAIVIPNAKAWFGLVQCTVADLNAITNTSTSICHVAAIIDDV